jgi:hypothetical protein
MPKMSFSIPDDVAEAFDKAFAGEDKNAVIAELIRKAVAEREPIRRPTNLLERSRRIRAAGREVSEEEIRHARQELRE